MQGRRRFKRKPVQTSIPVLREIFNALDADGRPLTQIAKEAGVTPQTMTAWRKGKFTPSIFHMEQLAALAGCEITIRPIAAPSGER